MHLVKHATLPIAIVPFLFLAVVTIVDAVVVYFVATTHHMMSHWINMPDSILELSDIGHVMIVSEIIEFGRLSDYGKPNMRPKHL